MPRLALLSPQHVLDHTLRRDTSVVTARQPKGGLALHAIPSNHDILQRVTQSVAHVQSTGDVGRRVHDDEATSILDLAILLELGLEETLLLPPAVPGRLDGDGVVGLEMGVVE